MSRARRRHRPHMLWRASASMYASQMFFMPFLLSCFEKQQMLSRLKSDHMRAKRKMASRTPRTTQCTLVAFMPSGAMLFILWNV